MDRVDRLSEGTRKELGRNSEDLLILGCSGVPATCVQEESARSSRWEKLHGSDLKSSNFPSQQTEKKRVSLVFFHVSSSSEIQTLKSTAFSLVHL